MRLLLLTVPVLAAHGWLYAGCAPSHSMTSEWTLSSLPGHASSKPSYWTSRVGAQAEWRPGFNGPVEARVAFYKIVYTSGNDPGMPFEIVHAGGAETRSVNASAGETGWEDLGRYRFAGTCEERVLLTKQTPGVNTRIAAVRFDVLSEASGQTIASFILDQVTGNAPGLLPVSWIDLESSPFRSPIERLSFRGFLEGATAQEFGGNQPVGEGDFSLWLMRAAGRMPMEDGGAARRPSTPELRSAAADWARSAGLTSTADPERPLTRDELKSMTLRVIPALGVNLDWLPRQAGETADQYLRGLGMIDRELDEGDAVTRLHAALLFRRFVDVFLDGGPPRDRRWRMTFQDEFEGDSLDRRQWPVESASPGHILSSRWPENIEVNGGLLHLITRRENRGGKEWTTGHLWSAFRQQYGYFEARMRIGAASGLNNAFWLMTSTSTKFEIDITEAHYPRRHTFTLHDYRPDPRVANGKQWTSNFDLSEDFHVYAVLWNEQMLTFFLDGKEVGRTSCDFCRDATPLRLSSAIGAWAGPITDALDGTRMQVDWVRVYISAQE